MVISSGTGLMPRVWAIQMVIGAIRMMVVTLSRKSDKIVVTVPRVTISSQGLPFDQRPATMAAYWKKPVCSSRPTRIIIPRSRPMVLKSIASRASSSE